MATISYPGFKVTFYMQSNRAPLIIREKGYVASETQFDNQIVSISTNNDMSNDNPVFTIVLNSTGSQWDKLLSENDIVSIQMSHDYYKKEYYTVMVGMISNLQKRENYSEGIIQYVITGMGLSKVLSNVKIGNLQGYIPIPRWLPDDPNTGVKFTGQMSGQIISSVLGRFIYNNNRISYTYRAGNNTVPLTYFLHDNIKNNVDERLVGSQPYENYNGTLIQFIKTLSAPPFNELFWTFPDSTTSTFNYRPVQFDESLWRKLPRYTLDNDYIYQVEISKNDVEQYAVFKVNIPQGVAASGTLNMGIFPVMNRDLIKKYGYKALEVDNPYIYADSGSGSGTSGVSLAQTNQSDEDAKKNYPSRESVVNYLSSKDGIMKDGKFKTQDDMRKDRTKAASLLYSKYTTTLGMAQCRAIIDAFLSKSGPYDILYYINETDYQSILKNVPYQPSSKVPDNSQHLSAQTKLTAYTEKLFNWYADNSKFYSGNIIVLGRPDIQVGSVLMWYDMEAHCIWEAYIEGVNHDYSYSMGYLTTIGITRGVPIPQTYTGDPMHYRFTFFWGKAEQFTGGYLGEMNLKEMQEAYADDGESDEGMFGSVVGSDKAMSALNVAKACLGRKSKYVWGGGRTTSDPLKKDIIQVDCSSFVWWCYHNAGVDLKGGKQSMNTTTIASDTSNLRVISPRNSNKTVALKAMKLGDIIFFDTYKRDGHVAIYAGDGDFIGAQSGTGVAKVNNFKNNSYWWSKFSGHVMRYGTGIQYISR